MVQKWLNLLLIYNYSVDHIKWIDDSILTNRICYTDMLRQEMCCSQIRIPRNSDGCGREKESAMILEVK